MWFISLTQCLCIFLPFVLFVTIAHYNKIKNNIVQKPMFLRGCLDLRKALETVDQYFILCNTTTGPLLFSINNYEICNSSITSSFSNLPYIDKDLKTLVLLSST